MANMNRTKVITGINTKLSYFHGWEPVSINGGAEKSGCYARVSLNFYAFNSNGNKGIACGLGNIQKIRDGESLGGKTTAADDFGAVVDDDFLA